MADLSKLPRRHQFYAGIAGEAESVPEPVTIEEQWLKKIYENSGGGGTAVQSDWNETDDTKADYIKNKPDIPDVSGKADKVSSATAGNFAGLDSSGNLTDSGKKAADFEIAGTATGTSITLTDSADGYLQGITIKGHSEVVSGSIKSVGDAGWGVIDLGTLTWSYSLDPECFISIETISPKPIIPGAGDNGLCSNYIVVTNATVYNMPNKSVLIGSGSVSATYRVCVKDSDYTDATTFKTAMSGVILYYPLASTTGATPTLGITAKNDMGQGTAATITTALPLRSVSDSVYDIMDNEKVEKKCISVKGSEFSWTRYGDTGFYSSNLSNPASVPNAAIFEGYIFDANVASPSNMDNKHFTIYNNRVYVIDTSYSDASTFGTAIANNELIYSLATPTTTSLTASERSALATLCTYDSTTHIDATDSPSMTVDYLKNTDNGKAVARIQNRLQAQIDALSS